ncbi:MAG: electron transfer flavoprotein subunit alpha/FixB family protein [Firmicutes bacterium]|nr:electron transfer flavoprotein subunit alpha/FixB family protein [Bacillota bacterium]
MGHILVVAELENGRVSDPSRELITKARELGEQVNRPVAVAGFGPAAADALQNLDADDAYVVKDDLLAEYHPELAEAALLNILQNPTDLVLVPNTTMGMDLGASVAARRNWSMVAYCTDLAIDGETVVARSQVYGGKLAAEVEVPLTGAVVTVIPGSWPSDGRRGSPTMHEVSAPSALNMTRRRVIEADAGNDVDITRADILVSVGRGIQDPDNLELAEELAAALGGMVSCSRPVVDAGWLPRSRQVGKSGKTVKPKVYLALGISGAPEHLQGMKDADLIIAVNSDANAPIFDVAHYGATADMLELMPILTEKLQGRAG